MKPLFVFGTGGHAQDLGDVAYDLGWRPVFLARDPIEMADWTAEEDIVLEEDAVRFAHEAFAIGIGDNAVRARIAGRYAGTLRFPSLLHPDATFGRRLRADIGERPGTVLFAGARLTHNVTVGAFCTLNLNVTVSHDVEIGDFANLSPGANVAGNVAIGEDAWIGLGAAINQGARERKLHIGTGCIIGSGAVVISDCEPNSVYVGVPARKIR